MITKQYTEKKYTNDNNQYLLQLGWTSHFQTQLKKFYSKEFIPARVVGVRKNEFRVSNGRREWLASVAGRLKHHTDCSHSHEPGCQVIQAVIDGEILQGRLESYRKMKRELAYLSHRQHKSADRVEKERWKEVALKIKAMNKR